MLSVFGLFEMELIALTEGLVLLVLLLVDLVRQLATRAGLFTAYDPRGVPLLLLLIGDVNV